MTVGSRPARAPRGWRRAWSRIPLRFQMAGITVTLVALALIVTGTTAAAELRGYLTGQVDNQLGGTANAVQHRLANGQSWQVKGPQGSDEIVRIIASDGRTVEMSPGAGVTGYSPPEVASSRRLSPGISTVRSEHGPVRWQVLVRPLPAGSYRPSDATRTPPVRLVGARLLVATPLDTVDATVSRLKNIVWSIGGGVLVIVTILGYAAILGSLRSLRRIESTATAITGGDLTQRVPLDDPRTEIGRLAYGFNAMVDRIEAAFAAQSASESAALESANRMRRFIADASHELRTPLTSIRGYAELYRQGAVTGQQQSGEIIRRIEDEAARVGLLVDDLLLLARMDSQRPLRRSLVDVVTVASDAVAAARVVAPERNIALRIVSAPVVRGDQTRLRQVLDNLLGNALRHTPTGAGITVTVDEDPASSAAVLAVSDSGPGMSTEQAAHVFERFYRADPARSRPGGSGLGLAIVQALVAATTAMSRCVRRPGRGPPSP